jgi:tRNA pseudouridine13 synthase
VQYVTIFHGPQRNLTHHGIHVRYLGQLDEPYRCEHIRANRFRLVLRELTEAALARAQQALAEVRAQGVPNYFDDQRFGSVSSGETFVARELVFGRFEEALRLALAAPYAHDRAVQKQEKAILRQHWGNWTACRAQLPRGHARSLADYLVHHPGDFRGAVERLRPELRGLYLSAYQSHLWNRMLARWLEQSVRPEQLLRVRLRLGDVPMHARLDPEQWEKLARLQLPLPSARLHLAPADPRLRLIEAVLAEEGLQLRQLQIKGSRKMFFSRGERPALCLPAGLGDEAAPDERHPGRRRLTLTFELPRGCYATLIVKRITAAREVGHDRFLAPPAS